MTADAMGVIAAGYSAMHLVKYYVPNVSWSLDNTQLVASILFVMFINNYVLGRMDVYGDRKYQNLLSLSVTVGKALLTTFAILAGVVFILDMTEFPRSYFVIFAGLCLIYMITGKVLVRGFFDCVLSNGKNTRQVLIVGDLTRGKIVTMTLSSQASWGHHIIGRLKTSLDEADCADTLGTVDNFHDILRRNAVDEVVFAIDNDPSVNISELLNHCRRVGLPVRILPALWQPGEESISVESLQGIPFITIKQGQINATDLLYKRLLDICGGLTGLLLLFIMYPFIGIAIKLDSPGPVIFKQKRVGRNGRIFNLYKFRSMHEDAEQRKQKLMNQNEMNGFMFKMNNDPRITKVGRFLRKTSLDEFPQFINVLKGEMSLVGTRPPTVDEVSQYDAWHLKRISAKPGITGLWQVSGRNRINDFDQVVRLDCQYLDRWRFTDDIKIIMKTVTVVLKRKGAL